MIQARLGHRVIVYKNKLFVFAGYGKDECLLKTVEMFSPEENKFVMMAPMKIARGCFGCCRVGNLVFVVGGWAGDDISTRSLEIYNLDNNTWTDGVDFPKAGWYLNACAVNNKLE